MGNCLGMKHASIGKEVIEEKQEMVPNPLAIANQPIQNQIYMRRDEWVGFRNLHNTCYINSGKRLMN